MVENVVSHFDSLDVNSYPSENINYEDMKFFISELNPNKGSHDEINNIMLNSFQNWLSLFLHLH